MMNKDLSNTFYVDQGEFPEAGASGASASIRLHRQGRIKRPVRHQKRITAFAASKIRHPIRIEAPFESEWRGRRLPIATSFFLNYTWKYHDS
jgi:hypothetical protein